MKKYIQLNIEKTIHSAHFIPNHKGKCKNLHGHSWKIQMSVSGLYDQKQGMLVDFGDIGDLIRSFDHVTINDRIKFPSAENMSKFFALKILRMSRDIVEVTVTVWESEDSSATSVVQNSILKYQETHKE
jgi:6-pyruvoyltetrahydropterin/6-carboxytetrahydropterin synthase